MQVNVKDDSDDKKADKPSFGKKPGGPPGQGGPPPPGGPPGPGAQQALHNPPIGMPKAGQGLDPMQAMMGGIDPAMLAQMGPPPPPSPGAAMGPNGLPVGGNLPSSDPMFDPSMDGSSLFQALNMQLDPYAAGPDGQDLQDPMQGDPQMGLEQLLQMLALAQAGAQPDDMGSGMPGMPQPGMGMGNPMGRPNPSGMFNEPHHPGQTIGLNPFNVTQ